MVILEAHYIDYIDCSHYDWLHTFEGIVVIMQGYYCFGFWCGSRCCLLVVWVASFMDHLVVQYVPFKTELQTFLRWMKRWNSCACDGKIEVFKISAQMWSLVDHARVVTYSAFWACSEPPKTEHFCHVQWFERNEATGSRSCVFT